MKEIKLKAIKLKAMAKINLGLDVTRKREDGYHEVRMIMQSINMYDQIRLSPLEEPQIRVKTNVSFLPVNEDNLVYKAAKLLMDEFQVTSGVEIDLRKFIPTAAGMGGGSSDAAAVLVGVNRMFQLGLTKRELMERSVAIGADVPFCVLRGTALAEAAHPPESPSDGYETPYADCAASGPFETHSGTLPKNARAPATLWEKPPPRR